MQQEKQLKDLYNLEAKLHEIVKPQPSQDLLVLVDQPNQQDYSVMDSALGNANRALLLMKTNLKIWATLTFTKPPYHDGTSLFNMENEREN